MSLACIWTNLLWIGDEETVVKLREGGRGSFVENFRIDEVCENSKRNSRFSSSLV